MDGEQGSNIAAYHLVATFLVIIVLGLNIFLCSVCVQILIKRRRNGARNASLLTSVAVFQLLFSTGHAGSYVWGAFEAFIRHGTEPRGPTAYLNEHWGGYGWRAVMMGSFAANEACFNSILVWRCHVVMNADWRFSIPLGALTVAAAAAGFGSTYIITTLSVHSDYAAFVQALSLPLNVSELSSAIVQNTSSIFIAWKVWSLLSQGSVSAPKVSWRTCSRSGTEWTAVRIGMESGALRTLCGLVLIALFWAGSMGILIAGALAAQLNATAPYLIIIRTESLRAAGAQNPATDLLSDVFVGSSQPPEMSRRGDLTQRRTRAGSVDSPLP